MLIFRFRASLLRITYVESYSAEEWFVCVSRNGKEEGGGGKPEGKLILVPPKFIQNFAPYILHNIQGIQEMRFE